MAVTQVMNNGTASYSVYINLRSKLMPHIRLQKRLKGIKTKAEAVRKERNLLRDLSHKIAQHEGHGMTWRMIVSKWSSTVCEENYLDKTYNPSTIKDYISMMHNWTKNWLDRPAVELTRGEGREVLNSVINEGRTKAFQKRLKNTINMIYCWAIEERIIRGVHQSPVYGLKIILKEEKRPEILKTEEIRTLLYESKSSNHNWYSIWAMALLTGMRNGELYALKWDDVDLDNSMITVQRSFNKRENTFKSTKAGYWRTVPISTELKSLILEIKNQSKSEFVLQRLPLWRKGYQAKILKTFCKSIGLPEIKFHTLRACFATQLIGSGVEPIKVMKICGWKDLKTMSYYLRLSGIDEKGATEGLNFLPNLEANVFSINC
ncbi:MAG: site-specific integrase [Bacteriovoracaceae bacterium]|jgi:integrase|nr:site-specific integrase [Bacteriovoracaceae bacterium]